MLIFILVKLYCFSNILLYTKLHSSYRKVHNKATEVNNVPNTVGVRGLLVAKGIAMIALAWLFVALI